MLAGCADEPGTYDAACSVPLPGWRLPKDGIGHLVPVLLVKLRSDGEVFSAIHTTRQNSKQGDRINDAELSRRLADTVDYDPPVHIVLYIAATAPCKRVKQVRHAMQRSGVCPQHCSEGRNWETWPFGNLP
jgi:hypothetical protein